jgi:eukaryotic-like serine/threonine-protein kinase
MMSKLYHGGDIIAEKYQIITLLGEGGMGKTYSAISLENNQKVAIKVVSFLEITDWKILELFAREAKILSVLDHPFIPRYLDYFSMENDQESPQTFYLVQELIEGKSLSFLIENKYEFTEKEIKNIASQVLAILQYLHGLNPPVIHRDIKPDNIIMNEKKEVFLVDFGSVQDIYRNTISYASTFVGTLGYMSLEQMRGQTNCSSDLYSLGATLIFLITHLSPYLLPQKRMKIDFIKASKIQLSKSFEDWLNKMIDPIIEDRFQSVKEALKELNFKKNNPRKGNIIPRQKTKDNIFIKQDNNTININIKSHQKLNQIEILGIFIIPFMMFIFYLMLVTLFPMIIIFLFYIIISLYFLLRNKLIFFFRGIKIIHGNLILNINSENITITKKTLFNSENIILKVTDISLVQLEEKIQDSKKDHVRYYLIIWEGVTQYHLLIGNNKNNAHWLTENINDFLEKIKI